MTFFKKWCESVYLFSILMLHILFFFWLQLFTLLLLHSSLRHELSSKHPFSAAAHFCSWLERMILHGCCWYVTNQKHQGRTWRQLWPRDSRCDSDRLAPRRGWLREGGSVCSNSHSFSIYCMSRLSVSLFFSLCYRASLMKPLVLWAAAPCLSCHWHTPHKPPPPF